MVKNNEYLSNLKQYYGAQRGHFERYEMVVTKMLAYLTFSQNSFIWWNFVV